MHAHASVAVMSDAETKEVIARAASGDAAAFEELVRQYHPSVIRWAVVAVGDLDEAEDLAQSVWMRVYRNLGDFRGASQFGTWLYRITYNLGFEVRRTRFRRTSALVRWTTSGDHVSEIEPPRSDGDATLFSKVVQACVNNLPPRQRAVLTLVDFEGRSAAEAAEMLEIEEGTVRSNLFKARRAIRERLLQDKPQLMEELRS
jgi:RNA polymerase sigma-70 factor (ECF subfamily)